MITKNGLLRPNRTSPLITGTKPKSKPTKIESNEPEIDFNNIPTIQGTYKATKINETTKDTNKMDVRIESNVKNVSKVSKLDEVPKSNVSRIEDTTKLELTSVKPISTTTTSTTRHGTTTGIEVTTETVDLQKELTLSTIEVSSATPSTSSVVFKDFPKPDFETSPWKPIVPGYVNTELKLLPETGISSGNVGIDSTVKSPTYEIREKIVSDGTNTKLPNRIPIHLDHSNARIDVPGMSTLDEEDTDFPHDRIVPEDMVNFRVNGKFKNKIPGLLEDGNVFTAPTPAAETFNRPSIEVSGQLPSETYDLRLSTSSELAKANGTRQHYYQTIEQTQKMELANTTDESKAGYSSSTTSSSIASRWNLQTIKSKPTAAIEESSGVSGIGIAEPVPDVDENLETRSRLSGIESLDKEQNDALRDRKVDRRPIYTSYRSPDLSGSAVRPSLIENPGTLKPFRHTIPVDKITSAIASESDNERLPLISPNQDTNISSIVNKDDKKDIERTEVKDKWITSMNIKEATETINADRENQSSESSSSSSSSVKIAKIELAESTKPTRSKGGETIDDEKVLELSTTEIYSEMLHPPYNNGQKLIMKDDESKEVMPEKLTSNVSRNSTFIQVDTVQHVPNRTNGDNANDFENKNPINGGENVSVNAHLTTTPGTRKKIYNDTLKAYVVENLVTLAPAKSNTGVGRPVRPRPKIENQTKTTKSSGKTSAERLDETALLEKLFGLQGLERDNNKRNSNLSNGGVLVDGIESTNATNFPSNKNTHIEQIVEVVTSVSTKVSSKQNPDRVVLRFVVTNSTSPPIIRSEANKKSDKLTLESTEEKRSFFKGENLSAEPITIQTSDRKISTLEEDRFILDKLKQLAEVRTRERPLVKTHKNSSNVSPDDIYSEIKVGPSSDDRRYLQNFDELKKIADVAMGNETLKNGSSLFALSRDGVRILTKIMNKVDDGSTHKGNLTNEESPVFVTGNN